MKEQLIQLLNTMGLIETKGESTLIMADCVRCVNNLIQECEQKEMKEGNLEPATE